jgi:hypothetical protein
MNWNTKLWRLQKIFIQCMWGLSTLLTINVSSHFVCKKQNSQRTNLFVLQNHVSVTELPHNWKSMKLKQGSKLELNDSANVGSVIVGNGQLLVSLFQHL